MSFREQRGCSKMCCSLCRKSLLCHCDRGSVLRRCIPTFFQAEPEKPVPTRMQGKSCRHSKCELSGGTAWDEPAEFPLLHSRSQATLCLVQWGSAGWLLTKVSEPPWHTPNHLSCEAFLAFAQLEFAGVVAELKLQMPKVGLRQKQPS